MMNKTYNLAIKSEQRTWKLETLHSNISRPCVFISHQHGDKPACRKIAKYIKNAGLNIFFDEDDPALQVAVLRRDPFKITERIKEGIRESSHMLCVVSKNTEKSRWVPFEVGYGHAELVKGEVTRENNPYTVPPRLYKNVACNYAKIYSWNERPSVIQNWIHEAFQNRFKVIPDNSYSSFAKNRSSKRWY